MNKQTQIDFNKIAAAIKYIEDNYKLQPGLDEVARKIGLSPYHFQRLFTKWAGTSPKKFLQYISLGHAKKILKHGRFSVLETAYKTGLSGSSRLHDLFVRIEGMTPGEYKNGGASLNINYSFAGSPFGKILIASTSKGVCRMTFAEDEGRALASLQNDFPNAAFKAKRDPIQQNALVIFTRDWTRLDLIKLHLKGTVFQLKVWETLLKIPLGQLEAYGSIAKRIKYPKANRAVGTAVGSNPVAILIPCHRVIQSTGAFGNYYWGSPRKKAMIGWEAARAEEILKNGN